MANATQQQYRLENLTCANCAAKFERNVSQLPQVEGATVNFGASKLSFAGDATLNELESAGAFDGIRIVPISQRKPTPKVPFFKRRENIVSLISLIFLIAGLLTSSKYGEINGPAILLFAISIVVGGTSMFVVGLRNLARLEFDMNTLMTIAIIGAAIIGEWREAAVVVLLFAISEALESYSMNKARQSISSLVDIAPSNATIRRNGETFESLTEDIRIGDVLLVKPGQKLAMDGTVLSGQSTVNQAAITGESVPITKRLDDTVFAGTLNEEGSLEVMVTKLVEDTTIAKIIDLVENAQAEKAPSQMFIDKFAKYYTPVIIVIAALTAVVPPLLGADWQTWIYQGLAVLVVGCPCALVVSTPVAIVTAIGNAARQGVLIKGGVHLEEMGHIKTVAFDKTGTLTKGYPEITDMMMAKGHNETNVLQAVAAVERLSQHPLARAIVNASEARHLPVTRAVDFQSITGKGAVADVEGQHVSVGSISWMKELTTLPEEVLQQANELQTEGKSVIGAVIDGTFAGIFAVADPIRTESKSVLDRLKAIGIDTTVMLTGDDPTTAQAIARKLGIDDVRAGLMPEDKLTAIRELSEGKKRVAMIGDGINDAPALAAASVGIAMGGAGTDAALETADIALMADDLEQLPYTVKLSRKTLRTIKENIMFAVGLKIVALLLVIPGWLTLWIAIFADMGATLLVVLNSLRLMRIQK